MRNFQGIFETCKQSFISGFSICVTVPFMKFIKVLFSQREVKP